MKTCIIDSPLGYTKIVGDENGIISVSILDKQEDQLSESIPEVLS